MAKYYTDGPQNITSERRLVCDGPPSYYSLVNQVKEDEVLVALYSKGDIPRWPFQLCPYIDCPQELQAWEVEYKAGQYIKRDFYAVPKNKVI